MLEVMQRLIEVEDCHQLEPPYGHTFIAVGDSRIHGTDRPHQQQHPESYAQGRYKRALTTPASSANVPIAIAACC